ncbi:hypothetical protein NSPZN2_30181 [Nitrospira defluvii]|uniref:Uncharacterized protein n=1 Tax=Nitrospira defluvii TaxID=330214 RepID=A0ABM8RG80_9BACT|nr:hypothetical protein NSPZN2_30181 [Nitrospira defluvii]
MSRLVAISPSSGFLNRCPLARPTSFADYPTSQKRDTFGHDMRASTQLGGEGEGETTADGEIRCPLHTL